ncbi:MAG: type I secretion C-terminal target domain-containing protein, partial [Sulfurovaceae bacterium]|nr:type I secretion C-terminal target domain-containing protein [Sulfurovaceae bacterium]
AALVNSGADLPAFVVIAESTTGLTSSNTANVTPPATTDVNDAPTSTNDSITILEDMNNTTGVYTLTTNDFGTYSDEEGSALSSIRIDSLPTNGVIYLNGVAITSGAVISLANITAGNLTFNPTDNSDADSSFTFNVSDGTDWSSASYTTAINITAVADAPTITTGTVDYTVNTFNANFEGSSGLSGWSTGGTVVVESNSLTNSNLGALTSIEGTQHVLLRAEGVANAGIATALGTTAANLSAATTNNNATNGSYIQTQVYAHIGDVITVQYNFINAETQTYATGAYDDAAVAVVNGVVTKLSDSSDIANDNLNYDNNSDIETTGWRTFTYVATADGYINLGLAILNAGDDTIDSYMMVDNVLINGQDPRLTTFDLNLNVNLVDTDGSEHLTVTLSDFPGGTTFSMGALDATSGDWVITLAPGESLADIQATLPAGYDGAFNYNVTAITTDSNGDTATSVAHFADERYLADAPTLSTSVDGGTYLTDIVYSDNFNTNLGSWTGTNIDRNNNAMRIDGAGDTATNTYDFGVEHAGETVTMSFDTEINTWSNDTFDHMFVSVNGTQIADISRNGLDTNRNSLNSGSVTHTFTATVGSDGKVVILIRNNSNRNTEDLWIDNFNITLPLNVYQYDLTLNAGLTDSSETLSDITLTNIPASVILKDSNGNVITQNGDGSYSVALDGNGDAVVSIISSTALSSTDLSAITSSVTSTNTLSNDSSETIIGGSGNDSLYGGEGSDHIYGGEGSDHIYGGAGNNDTIDLSETTPATDVIYWTYTDGGVDGSLATDTLTGFNTTGTTHDVLNISDLLVGESGSSTDIGNLLNYIQIDTGTDSTIHLSSDGGFTGGTYNPSAQNQTIVLHSVDLSSFGSTDEDIVKAMINSGVLVV